ncbi:MAG TPA: heme-binding protein [Dehalococcoidia bacterium]|nr:heme-binding protein [Dehalococcoidia bacterium]
MPLTLEQAEKIVEGAIAKAREMNVNIGISVVDAGGHLVAFSRMSGAGIITVDMSRDKAFTSVAFRADTLTLSQRLGQNAFFASGPEVGGGRLVLLGGGVPVVQGNELLGAVGVGGATPEQDADCAKAGIAAAGLG